MMELYLAGLTGIIFPILLFIIKKLYYINHLVTEIKVNVEWIQREIEEIKAYIYKRRR